MRKPPIAPQFQSINYVLEIESIPYKLKNIFDYCLGKLFTIMGGSIHVHH